MKPWADHAILWHVYPLGFTGAERTAVPRDQPVNHRLGKLAGWLDYAVELGCSGLLLGPVFASQTHGYDTIDHFRIDPRLGDEDDFDALVCAADQRGLRIVLDGVFNHVGRGFPAFRAAVNGGPGTPAARWFKRDQHGGFADRFPVDPGGLAVAETAEPGAAHDDPLLVPAHSWTILAG